MYSFTLFVVYIQGMCPVTHNVHLAFYLMCIFLCLYKAVYVMGLIAI